MSFKVADGYVEVHARHDRASTRRNAREAANVAEEEGRSREGSMLRWLFKSNPSLHSMLVQPIAGIFSSPLIFAAASVAAVGIAGILATAITTALLTGIFAGFVGIGAFVQRQNPKIVKSYEKMTSDIKGVFKRASMPIVEPLSRAMDMIGAGFKRMEPSFNRIYKAFAPLIEPFTGGLIGFLEAMLPGIERAMPGIEKVVLALADHLPGLGTSIGDFFATLAENGPLLERVVGLMITWLEMFFKVAGPLIVILMQNLADWADGWNKLTDGMKAAIAWIEETWKKIPGWWDETWGAVKGWFSDLGTSISNFFSETWASITKWWDDTTASIETWWANTWGKIETWFEELPGKIGTWLSSLPGVISGWFQTAFDAVFYAIGFAVGSWLGAMMAFPGQAWQVLQTGWDSIMKSVGAAFTWILNTIMNRLDRSLEFIRGLPTRIGTEFNRIHDTAMNWIRTTVTDVGAWFDRLPNRLGVAAINAWNSISRAFTDGGGRVLNWFTGWRDRVFAAVGRMSMGFHNAGRDAIEGLINGIDSLMGWAVDRAWHAARRIAEGFMDALIIGSPSKYMADKVGKWIPKGIMVGIEDNMGDIDKFSRDFPDTLTSGVRAPSGSGMSTTDQSTNYGGIKVEVHVDNIQELADIQAFLDGQMRNNVKARNWAGNLYEAQGEYVRSYQ